MAKTFYFAIKSLNDASKFNKYWNFVNGAADDHGLLENQSFLITKILTLYKTQVTILITTFFSLGSPSINVESWIKWFYLKKNT